MQNNGNRAFDGVESEFGPATLDSVWQLLDQFQGGFDQAHCLRVGAGADSLLGGQFRITGRLRRIVAAHVMVGDIAVEVFELIPVEIFNRLRCQVMEGAAPFAKK